MDSQRFNRVNLLVGDDAFNRIRNARVIIFGVGGVGSWAAESLARTGIGHITLVDCDRVEETNINRQLPATELTVGRVKTDVMTERLKAINPDIDVVSRREYYTESTTDDFDLASFDYVIDAIDTLSDKALLILNSCRAKTRLFSSMGAALKMDATQIGVAEFYNVKGCPLAAALRNKFKRLGVKPSRKFKCIYSPEIYRNRGEVISERKAEISDGGSEMDKIDISAKKASVNGTVAHTTAIFGFMLAGLVVEDLCRK